MLGMKISKLNFGGFAGGAICLGGAIAILMLLNNGHGIPRGSVKLIIFATIGGAALGNWIWQLALPNQQEL